MNAIFRLALASLATAATLRLAASPFATTAAGVGTALADKETTSSNAARSADPDWPAIKRTPTGQMFKWPLRVPKLEDIAKTASGWEYSGQIEFGYIGGDADERNAQYRMYQDLDQGSYLNNLDLSMKKADGSFLGLTAGGAGRRDQYYGLDFGRANAWHVKLFFNETPHIFTNTYKSLWNGVGTANLTLLPGLPPGGSGSTPGDNAALAATATAPGHESTLGLTRKRYGVRLDLTLTAAWKAFASYALEQRKGARPFGSVWGNSPGNNSIEVPESIDYDTTDLAAGVTYAGRLNAFNLRLSASLFKNNLDTLTFQEPERVAPNGVTTTPAAGAFTQGRFDLTPSNQAYNARAEYTRKLPSFYNGFVTAVVSAGTWRQNDSFIPYTTIPNIALTNVTVQPGGDWSTLGSLSRTSLDGTIDTRLADLTLSLNPTSALNVKLKARSFETDNNTNPYYAVNPNAVYVDADNATAGAQTRGLTLAGYTGVFGRLINDGSGNAGISLANNANPSGNVEIRNQVYSSKQFRLGPTADYQLNKTSNLNFTAEREITERTHAPRNRTWEDRYKLGYVNRSLPLRDSALRVSYEFAQRRGSTYVTNYYDDATSAALFPMPTTIGTNVNSWAVRNLGALRYYYLSDRDQHTFNVRLDTPVRSNLDAGLSLQSRQAVYPDAAFGRGKDSSDSANLDLNYQPSAKQNIYAFYSYQQGRIRQATIQAGNGNAVIGAVTPLGTITPQNAADIGEAPGGPVYPLGNAWSAKSTDRNHVVGAGVKQELGKATLNVDYTYSLGRTRLAYRYTIGGAVNAAQAPLAGSRLPDLASDVSYLDASLRYPLSERIALRLIYRNQWETIRDWHYRTLEATPVVVGNPNQPPTAVVLDGGPMNYRVNWYGVMFQIKL